MRGSASKISSTTPQQHLLVGLGACPTRSRLWPAGGTAKMRVDWMFVSGVSLVSPVLELLERLQNGKTETAGAAINSPPAPCAGTGGTGAKMTGVSAEPTGPNTSETVRQQAPSAR
jgi:hypothetical protein